MGKLQGLGRQVTKLKYLLPALVVLILSGFFWLKEHDQRVAWKALADARADSIEARDVKTQELWNGIKSMTSAYAQALSRHKKDLIEMKDSIKTLDSEIDRLAFDLDKQLPEAGKAKLDTLVANCARQQMLVLTRLTACEALRAESDSISAAKSVVILRVTKSRDEYKKLWEEADEPSPSVWATVGKIETAGGILALVTKMLGLW